MARIQIVVGVLFVFFKSIRRNVLADKPPEFVQAFLLSFPNFCEGVIGVLTLTMLGLYFNKKLKISNEMIYATATILAAIFVITQEMKIHNLGGNNVYDPNDIVFSIVGLVVGFIIVNRMKPTIEPDSNLN